jgi:hypothetical protein
MRLRSSRRESGLPAAVHADDRASSTCGASHPAGAATKEKTSGTLERYVPNAQDAHLLQYSDPETPQGLLWFGTVPTEVASISFPSVDRPF